MKLSLGKILFLIIFCIFLMCIISYPHQDSAEEPIKAPVIVADKAEEIDVIAEPTEEFSEGNKEIVNAETLVNLGEFKLTAYCSCSICCDGFAYNRPIDEHGNEIVYGSTGERLTEGISIAVDPNVIPYGTEVIINEHTYRAQDCGGAIDGNEIDVYFENHQEALNFGIQYAEVHMITN